MALSFGESAIEGEVGVMTRRAPAIPRTSRLAIMGPGVLFSKTRGRSCAEATSLRAEPPGRQAVRLQHLAGARTAIESLCPLGTGPGGDSGESCPPASLPLRIKLLGSGPI